MQSKIPFSFYLSGLFVICSCQTKPLEQPKDLVNGDLSNSSVHLADKFTIANYNVFLRDYIVAPDGQRERAAKIPQEVAKIGNGQIDFIVHNELFIKELKPIMDKKYADLGFKYTNSKHLVHSMEKTNWFLKLKNKALDLVMATGGLAVYSRWPIEKLHYYVYRNCYGKWEGCLTAKGFIYAKVRKKIEGRSRVYHVFGTHLQAIFGKKSEKVRLAQLRELRVYLDKMKIPTSEPVFFVGDMNIDCYQHDYPGMLEVLNANPVKALEGLYTRDQEKNELVGRDFDANPCWQEYNRTKICTCCEKLF